ncbi:SRPBCC family protein [Cohnella nanjingensis]|uniref:SRPBCC domain-containing protein n=1 Tax=Cohnella nanjingensis TaxID=1387779 RepID=A0A7X0RQM1_9BACL|nr:SRPBCC domain-containing protein [Cohnella nanjingensis]MBB6671751.1 SRPBCC domain-containing protein [Cohnella nanjingensis]
MSQNATLPDIRQTLEFNAPIQKVWNAVSTAESIGAWFMPVIGFEPVVGREFELNAGPFGMSPCKVTELDPPSRLRFNWGKDWTLTFELKELDGGRTEFTLIHGGWSEDVLTEFGESHRIVRDRMAQGWTGIGAKLRGYVEG